MSDPKDCYVIEEGELVGMGEYPECFRSKQDADKFKEHWVDKAKYQALLEQAEAMVYALKLVQEISCSDEFKSVFFISQIHRAPYTGGQYGEKIDEALSSWQKFKEQM